MLQIGEWTFWISDGELPPLYSDYLKNAAYVDETDILNPDGRFYFLGLSKGEAGSGWPSLVLSQKYQDSKEIFSPGALLAAETSLLFVGAGERLLCYDVEKQVRLWEDWTEFGFWKWNRFEDYILMSAELEFAVWDLSGQKLWSTFVEPPWEFEVQGPFVHLNVMGQLRKLRLSDGGCIR